MTGIDVHKEMDRVTSEAAVCRSEDIRKSLQVNRINKTIGSDDYYDAVIKYDNIKSYFDKFGTTGGKDNDFSKSIFNQMCKCYGLSVKYGFQNLANKIKNEYINKLSGKAPAQAGKFIDNLLTKGDRALKIQNEILYQQSLNKKNIEL